MSDENRPGTIEVGEMLLQAGAPETWKRPRWPFWSKVRANVRLRTLLMLTAVIAPTLALISQSDRAGKDHERLVRALDQANRRFRAEEGRSEFLGHLGIAILQDADRVEFFRVGTSAQGAVVGPPSPGAVTVLDRAFASRLAAVLLDRTHYGYVNMGDDPNSQFGFRFRRGSDSIVILVSLGYPGERPGHQDLWSVVTSGDDGSVTRTRGPLCVSSDDLEKLVREAGGK